MTASGMDEATAWRELPRILEQSRGDGMRAQVAMQQALAQVMLQNQRLNARQAALDVQSQQLLQSARYVTDQIMGYDNRPSRLTRGGPR